MSGKILIIDRAATSRIVMKVKLNAAQYDVDTCDNCADAAKIIQQRAPDLVLVNLSDVSDSPHAFCRNLRNGPGGDTLVIIGTGVDDSSRARFAALDAGADDVLVPHVSDSLLLARIRSLLRRRNVGVEWQIRDGTSRALGFDEDRSGFAMPGQITVLAANGGAGALLVQTLQRGLDHRVQLSDLQTGLPQDGPCRNADLFVIDATFSEQRKKTLFQMIADIHARGDTQHAAKLVILPKGEQRTAAMLLDLGADDVAFAPVGDDELILRTKALVAHKLDQDCLRERVRSGLRAAVIDPLTGLFNRRYAETHLDRIAEQAQATGRQYAIMVLDIDHFKSVNDTYGHAAGDAVLRTLASRLRSNFRGIDLIARVGGEEFLVAMPNTSREHAHIAAERMRRLVNETPIHVAGLATPLQISVSVGIAVDEHEDTGSDAPQHLFALADAALYRAKSAGRNMVSIHMSAA
ncbi:response regulator receiver modulated diguanylate cyclase [Cognatiyoonia koreensis]|uniref:diguanylate cyclase n=1 Tax=Cognatiyoonia koreensis TaxID=364200 RepID=A0A1I0QE62_9RHOB|nr:diguanylate cyclase [Cognatiyoonia koreensis]SEW25365.1 response regulator receiver modulated diguanylate cyclase [Cognatiyoonia koreensis]